VKGKLRTRLNVGTACAVVVALAMIAVTWWTTEELQESTSAEQKSIAESEALYMLSSALWQLRIAVPEYLLADAERRRHILKDEEKWHVVVLTNLAAAVGAGHAEHADEVQAQSELRAQYARYKDARQKFFDLYQAGRSEEAIAWRGLTLMRYGADTVRALGRLEELQRRRQRKRRRRKPPGGSAAASPPSA
jgi:hypothetical protein